MDDAPERIWVDDWNDVCRKPSVCGVEYVRADLYAALEQERAIFQDTVKKLVALEQERDDFKLGFVDCLKGRSHELRRLQGIVEMAWKGYGYDQEWDCDCPVCAAIRTRTPHDTEGE